MVATTAQGTKRVLIVDDDPDVLDQVQMSLEAGGFNVVRAESRQEAEDWLTEQSPDLAVVDLMMETADAGFTLCHHLKKKYPGTPIIVLTSVSSETGVDFDAVTADERAWIKADVLLDKPIRGEQLMREVDRLLAR